MADDPRVEWHIANRYGIWNVRYENQDPWQFGHYDSSADRWGAGRMMDFLVRPDGNLVLASDNGGIWLMSESAAGTVGISDTWDDVAFQSLAQGPDDDRQVFAGGKQTREKGVGALYMTDLSKPLPMLDWIRLDSLRAQFKDVGVIFDIVVLRGSRVIVLACDLGILWSRLPPFSKLQSSSPDDFRWRHATFADNPDHKPMLGISSLAEGPCPPGEQASSSLGAPIKESLLAGGLGGDKNIGGLFVGVWGDSGDPDALVLRSANLLNGGVDVSLVSAIMGRSVVASFEPDRHIAYAACASTNNNLLLFVNTTDGGRHWNIVADQIVGTMPHARLSEAIGHNFDHNFCIGVSNTDSKVVAVGAQNGLLSFDGGLNWEKPGFTINPNPKPWEPLYFPNTDHLHADLTNIAFARATTVRPIVTNAYRVTSDGGLAEVSWGTGACVIETDVRDDGENGNLYAVVLEGNSLRLYKRRSRDVTPWVLETVDKPITPSATGAGCLMQSSFRTGDSCNCNLEVIVLEGNDLVHYWCAIQGGRYGNWIRQGIITRYATGAGCLIESDFLSGSHGNFEVVVPEGTDLVHYWHDSSDPGSAWHRQSIVTSTATGPGCLIQSSFRSGPHGNFEVIVLEGTDLVHYWHDNAHVGSAWQRFAVVTNKATGPGWFFQSDYQNHAGAHPNFELVVPEGPILASYWRDNSAGDFPWHPLGAVSFPGHHASGPGCVFQGDYGKDSIHGNFELVVPEGGAVVHYYRDNSRSDFPWFPTGRITDRAYTCRSNFNQKLATLEFTEVFGPSMLAMGSVAGPTQDNGNVNGIAGDDGTPWFRLKGEEGDGRAAFYLSGHSPRISTNLEAGYSVVNQRNDGEEGEDGPSYSSHWESKFRLLVRDDHGNGSSVIPLDPPEPGTIPAPAEGLKPEGQRFVYATVRSPENFLKGGMLAALAARGPDIFILLVDDRLVPPDPIDTLSAPPPPQGMSLAMHWEFWRTLQGSNVEAMASSNGLYAIVAVSSSVLIGSVTTDPGLPDFRIIALVENDLVLFKVSSMAVDSSVGSGACNSIAIVAEDEAYAVVNGGTLFVSLSTSRIACWNGIDWKVRGTVPLGAGETLNAVEVDPTTMPATVFAMSDQKVYISRDSGRSWYRASKNLPNALDCQGIRSVRDAAGSHLYLATHGRSMWVASTRGAW